MAEYELMLILRPDLEEEGTKTLKEVTKLIENASGKILKQESWGKRKLEYDIKKVSSGLYVNLYFQVSPSKIKSLDSKLRLKEDIIRFLINKKEKTNPQATS